MRHFSVSDRTRLLTAAIALAAFSVTGAGTGAPPPPQAHAHGNHTHDSGTNKPAATGKPAAKRPAGKVTARPAQNSCADCIERAPVLDPAKYAGWNDPDVRKSYEAARKYPETMDRIHCFCECKESPREHHKTLLTCFTTEHGAGCGICQHEAILAAKLKDQGASDEEVEATVESLHKTDGHVPTKGRGI